MMLKLYVFGFFSLYLLTTPCLTLKWYLLRNQRFLSDVSTVAYQVGM